MKEEGNHWKGDKPKEKNTAGSNIKDTKTGRKRDKGEPVEDRMAMNACSPKSCEP